jgi:hypothetical protein
MLKEVKQKPIFDKIMKHETNWIQLGYKCKQVNFTNIIFFILWIVIQLLQFKPSNAQNFISHNNVIKQQLLPLELQAAAITVHNSCLLHVYYTLKNFWQFCYMQETKSLSSCFIQLCAPWWWCQQGPKHVWIFVLFYCNFYKIVVIGFEL